MSERAEEFVRFVGPHRRRLSFIALRYAAGADDAQDLVQETLLRAWGDFSPDEERRYGRAWLFVILRNVAVDWSRAAGRRITLVPMASSELTETLGADPTEPFAPLPSMSDERFREFLDDRLAAAVDALDPAFREVLMLSVSGALSYREVSQVLDCPVGTVMSRMARARRALRERLASFALETGWCKEAQR